MRDIAKEALVFPVKDLFGRVTDRPDGADRPAVQGKRCQQNFDYRKFRIREWRKERVGTGKKKRLTGFHHNPAWARVARHGASDIGRPGTGNRRPKEMFGTLIAGNQADAGRTRMAKIDDNLTECLQNRFGTLREFIHQRQKSSVLGAQITWTRGTTRDGGLRGSR
ncbi:MAG TPA: hypothetical protein VHC04_08555 [Rhodopila sp.]|nr:hypothetical protein [Rhodopila sp.]HVZ07948.1 hypothetical protein [Rhodopila sp.]